MYVFMYYCILTVSGYVTAVKRKGTDSILGSAGGEATKTMKGSTGESKKVQCYIVYQSLLLTYSIGGQFDGAMHKEARVTFN